MLTEEQMGKVLKLFALGGEGEVFTENEAVGFIRIVGEYGIHGAIFNVEI